MTQTNSRKRSTSPKPKKIANKTLVFCTETNSKCKGVIINKNELELVVDLPSGFTMTLHKPTGRKLYIYRVGTLEFVSDGWAIA